MSSIPNMTGRDLYLRTTDTHTGKAVVRRHRVWDADLFIESQRQALRKDGENAGDGETPDPMRFIVTVATTEEYRAANRRSA